MEGLENLDDEDILLSDDEIAQLEEQDTGIRLPTKYLSNSQINLYMNCPERYRQKYVLGKTWPGSSNMSQGRLIHEVLEYMHLFKRDNRGQMPPRERHQDHITDLLDEHFEDVDVWDDKTPDVETAEKFSRKLTNIYYDKRLEDVNVRDAEKRFTMMVKGRIPFVGYVDLIEWTDENPPNYDDPLTQPYDIHPEDLISDVKTTGRKYGKHRIRNSLQLTLYADGLGVEKVGYDLLVQTKTGKTRYYKQRDTRVEGEKIHARDVVEDVAEAISAGNFPKTTPEHWMCSEKWCPFWDQCRGKHLQTPAGV